MIYIKKPVKIEAIELQKEYKSIKQCLEFMGQEVVTHGTCGLIFDDYCKSLEGGLIIKTLEGEHLASWGDMIIKGVHGEFYPCKPDIFKKTYYTEQEYAELK